MPVSLRVASRPCLLVGGGQVAARKAETLLRFGAVLTVVAPDVCSELESLAETWPLDVIRGLFQVQHLQGMALVCVATDDRIVNRSIAEQATQRNIPVNVVDDLELCTFITPSILDRDPLFVAVSSGGVSPLLSRMLRTRLETLIPSGYGRIARWIAAHKQEVRRRYPDARIRRRFWESLLQGVVENLILSGQDEQAEHVLTARLQDKNVQTVHTGEVYLVGGGPGDPDLLTFKALRLMQQADVVLYDRLVAKPVLSLVRRDAEAVYVGKRSGQHPMPQPDINRLMVELALQGKRVLRLKGGDPFIFGRGGEEIENLAAAGVPWQIVPGITAASGCASYAGIPLTHRDHAQSCLLVTGHLQDDKLDLHWDALLQPRQTIAVYMGTHGIAVLARELLARGMSAALPAAIIERGTTQQQRVHIGTLQELPTMVQSNAINPPAMIILGSVVTLHSKLAWLAPRCAARVAGHGH